MKTHNLNIQLTISKLFIYSLFFNGLAVATLKYVGVSLPYSIISILIFVFSPFAFFYMLKTTSNKGVYLSVKFLLISLPLILIFKVIVYGGVGLNNTLIYSLSILFFYLVIGLSQDNTVKLINSITTAGIGVLTISYVQYFGLDSLPQEFIELPRINSESINKDYIREIDDVLFFRPNGLIGNPITFGFLLLFLTNLFIYQYHQLKNKIYLYSAIASTIMIIILSSRSNILGVFIITNIFILFNTSKVKYLFYSSLALFSVVFGAISLQERFPVLQLIISRFTLEDEYAKASTEEHFSDFQAAIDAASEHLLLGIPLGVYTEGETIITDGAWFALLIEFGLPLFIIFSITWVWVLKVIWKLSNIDSLKGLLFPFFIYITFSNFVNSAMLSKNMFVFIWFLIGVLLNLYLLQQRKNLN